VTKKKDFSEKIGICFDCCDAQSESDKGQKPPPSFVAGGDGCSSESGRQKFDFHKIAPPGTHRWRPINRVAIQGGPFSIAKSHRKLVSPTEVNQTVAPTRCPNAELRTGSS
jgi:hypothetical protein